MALYSMSEVNLALGGPQLFENASLQIEAGERICLLGRNGSGKSTLLRLISGELEPDAGKTSLQRGVRVAFLPQTVPDFPAVPVFDIVVHGLGADSAILTEYHQISHQLTESESPSLLSRLSLLQHRLDDGGGWQIHRRVEQIVARLELDPDASACDLSAGLKRRVLLAKALVSEPDCLLLDEPTNHLDIPSIKWLEQYLTSYEKTVLFVSHDRRFISRLANRVIEIDRGRLTSWACGYESYLQRKEAALEIETKNRAGFDKKLAQEEVWVRKGLKARRTRNEGRVRALQKMRDERGRRRELDGAARISLQETERTGRMVLKVKDISFAYDDKPIIDKFSATIQRGDRIGIIGANGTGKTTLQRLLIGQLKPQTGEIQRGTNLEISYFDQLRDQLDDTISVLDNVSDGSDMLTINGKKRHTISYLQDFLFTPEQARSLTAVLSGGERNRLLLARLFAKPANLLVLDEPTNDLDVETLEILEEMLLQFAGTVILVSHDRMFLNNTVTSTIVLDGKGGVKEFVGGYDDWMRQAEPDSKQALAAKSRSGKRETKPAQPAQKLSYKEQRELDALPAQIERMEAVQAKLMSAMASPSFYQQPQAQIATTQERLAAMEAELSTAYERWEILEEKQNAIDSAISDRS
jgi:ABC transport system ATP-binding/permease protein